jgi:tyrosyl-tRNA synthetase
MALAQMQRHGHRPIALVGGGTGLVGDPSGKTEMRKILSIEQVNSNAESLKLQFAKFISFEGDKGLMLNNADWLTSLHYIDFLRDIGRHFSVNRMIKAESCKSRMESEEGLSFIEFNYMVLQSYDFLELHDRHQCRLQMGGSDQWGNIVGGIDLIRRMRGTTAFGITFPLITTSSGAKMGKTASGAVWLDPSKTTPYDYFQFWVNTDDRDVQRFLSLFTFLPMDEILSVKDLVGADLNHAKTILAFETTRLLHGESEGFKALTAAEQMFGDRQIPKGILPSSRIHMEAKIIGEGSEPTSEMLIETFNEGVAAFELFQSAGLTNSRSEARRLITQGGAYINGRRIDSFNQKISVDDVKGNILLLRAGKKKFHKIVVKS